MHEERASTESLNIRLSTGYAVCILAFGMRIVNKDQAPHGMAGRMGSGAYGVLSIGAQHCGAVPVMSNKPVSPKRVCYAQKETRPARRNRAC